jgi:hypothetical protein
MTDDMRIVYACNSCAATCTKLWREYQTFLNHSKLLCSECLEREIGRPLPAKSFTSGEAIDWWVAAVPSADMRTMWGFTSVPKDRCDWWYSLPDFPVAFHIISPTTTEEPT